MGLEPTTLRLRVSCSTDWASRATYVKGVVPCSLVLTTNAYLCASFTLEVQKSWAAVVAEWLRRLTRNQIPSGSAGSNPADCEFFSTIFGAFLNLSFYFVHLSCVSIVGSVVECSPATRAARVRFPDDAANFFVLFVCQRGFKFMKSKTSNRFCFWIVSKKKHFGEWGYRSPYLSHAKRALYHLS